METGGWRHTDTGGAAPNAMSAACVATCVRVSPALALRIGRGQRKHTLWESFTARACTT